MTSIVGFALPFNYTPTLMASSPSATQSQLNDREGLSPSPDEPSPGAGIADLLDEDDDDIESEPWDEQSSDSEGITEGADNDDDEYVGMVCTC